uniref:Ribonuclease R n=1 Tax=Candidatus Kentrum sp. FM TaxID=2126340 RepID=A0A450SDB7_9GAMM|nr:MAG: ribonuclease R [Candidatus Kentron sp. FM]VFJ59715.1 MAG: ribonuclease R [Candidatus Kentron sp. FM]VFK14409.1 MAG: ribonuclease R [Candidatus Kentron sp. FM]
MENVAWQPDQDPYAAREAQKYEHPIASREHLLHLLTERGVPLSFEEISAELRLADETGLTALNRRLRAMQRDGQIIRNRRRGYGLVTKMDLVRGRIVAHPDGFGFLIPENGGKDLRLSTREMRSVLHNDRAVVSVTRIDGRGRKQGRVVEVLERNTSEVVGRLVTEHGISIVIPDDKRIHHDILIPPDEVSPAEEGQIVIAEIIDQPSHHSQPVGRIKKVLGEHMAPGLEVDIAIHKHGLPAQWPAPVMEEADHFGAEVSEADTHGRTDLREYPLVTIDGPDARDFDDAVCCRRTPGGWKLLVAIADVSSYVVPGTALDEAARLRGNSVYFPGRVIPMLPEVLSNGLCSLNPRADRLCLACEILIDKAGTVIRTRFIEGIMRSHARFTYDEVAAILVTRDAGTRREHRALVPHLEELHRLYRVLARARGQRGAIDFDRPEVGVVLDSEQRIQRIEPLVRNDAHRIIEECMIAANVAAANFLRRRRMPALYRVHNGPTTEKLEDLRTFLRGLGLRLGGDEHPEPGHYATLLKRAAKRPDSHLIQTVLLRSLSQAVYNIQNTGHFGLAHDCYTHFTSPIRRYPDLLVHRAIRHLMEHGKRAGFEEQGQGMEELGAHCSFTERRADEATRDVIDRLKCEYIADKVGDVFPGIITAVTSFGLFVELNGIYVEGLVHVTALGNDYYHFDPIHHRLQGERTHRIYRLADTVTVRVVRVDSDQRKIDFELA